MPTIPDPSTFLKDWHKAMTTDLIERCETARLAGAIVEGIADDGSLHWVGDRDHKPEYACAPDRYVWRMPEAVAALRADLSAAELRVASMALARVRALADRWDVIGGPASWRASELRAALEGSNGD
jgi:hypothetical protein